MSYSMDTSALLEAWVRYYPMDVFPTLWEKLDELIENGRLLATDEVLREVEKKSDDLCQWLAERSGMFVPLDEALQQRAIPIINQFPSLTNTKAVMSGSADPFVIALAQERDLIVVMAETSKPTKPRLPMCARRSASPA